MRQTSLQAYEGILPSLQNREMQVYEVIEKAKVGITNNEIARYLGLPINCVTGRTNSLVKKKVVKSLGKRKDLFTGNLSHVWSK